MPWSEKDYPDSMKNLDSVVKRKAIDIGNAMVKEGYKESDAIRIVDKFFTQKLNQVH